jgi:hypothetical protein
MIAAALLFMACAPLRAAEPETVMLTLQAKAGAEQSLADVVARHYETAQRLDMLQPGAAHVTLRRVESDGRVTFVEILTWRDASVPDSAPKNIRALWNEMNALVETRSGRPGLDIVEMTTVTREK